MKVGITGAAGLLGFHVRALLKAQLPQWEVRLADRNSFASDANLDAFLADLDAVIHCAGMNRGPEAEVEHTNAELARKLAGALQRCGSRAAVVYANSTHVERDSAYGRGKQVAGEVLQAWGSAAGAPVGNFILPHVFGEFGKPFYNSAVSTFCHQLAHEQEPEIQVDGELELVHALDVAQAFVDWLQAPTTGEAEIRIAGRRLKVSEMLARLRALLASYRGDVVPNLGDPLDLALFNTLRSYLYPQWYPKALTLHQDARGSLFEAVKADQGGQTFLSTTVPGVTRGNHWHLRKIERFLVVGGTAVIRIRKLFGDEVASFEVSGDAPAFIDIPTMHTHSITNTGAGPLQTLFWSNEIFDPARPDTYFEPVQP